MKPILLVALIALICLAAVVMLQVNRVMGKEVVREPGAAPRPLAADGSTTRPATPLDFTVKDIDGKDYDLGQLKGKVVMFVNVASKCGFTPQYEGLEKIYEKYKDQGFVIVGFPANNFKSQEPGTNEEIKQFCSSKYHVTFPMMSKISVKGEDIHPLYKFLTEEPTAGEFKGEIGWNFTKFLIDRNGTVYARFASKTKPEDDALTAAIEKGLAAKTP
jgi:glutathione peroxidase